MLYDICYLYIIEMHLKYNEYIELLSILTEIKLK